jgi:NADH:ubiquinone oxidoreductase subunit 3 (subunit A)
MTDAIGLVALVAMMPLITVQLMGVLFVLKSRAAEPTALEPAESDTEIFELWEAA